MAQANSADHSRKDISNSWHALTTAEVLDRLHTTAHRGLTTQEVETRRNVTGYNQLIEAPRSTFIKMVIGQLDNFLVILLVVCAVTAAINPQFIGAANLQNNARLIGLYGIFSIGMGLVIITAGIDLSVGSIFALQGVLLARLRGCDVETRTATLARTAESDCDRSAAEMANALLPWVRLLFGRYGPLRT